jgi:hypothetical protein
LRLACDSLKSFKCYNHEYAVFGLIYYLTMWFSYLDLIIVKVPLSFDNLNIEMRGNTGFVAEWKMGEMKMKIQDSNAR